MNDPIAFLALPDQALADLYREWSEEHYCAGWIDGGESEFVSYLVDEYDLHSTRERVGYEEDSLKEIRRLLTDRLAQRRRM